MLNKWSVIIGTTYSEGKEIIIGHAVIPEQRQSLDILNTSNSKNAFFFSWREETYNTN